MTLTELLVPEGKYQEMVVDYLLNYTVENNWNKVEESQKPFSKCWAFIVDKARKQAEGRCAVVDDETVYKWAVEFYEGGRVSVEQIRKTEKPKKPVQKEEKKEPENEQFSLF